MVGVEGFEPSECQSQNLMPYHLATPQYKRIYSRKISEPAVKPARFNLVGVEGLEPSECQSQNLMPYHLATPQYEADKKVGWARWIRTIGMQESKSCALPLGDSPV